MSVQTYTAVRGDTFWGIAEYFYGDGSKYPIIQQYNNNYHLKAGDFLYIPPLNNQNNKSFSTRNNSNQSNNYHQVQQSYHNPKPKPDANTQKIQLMLKAIGYELGTLDGIWGQRTASVMKQFQQWYGLRATGQGDQDSVNALNEYFQTNTITVYGDVLQLMLHYAGYSPGAIDGVVGKNTKNAVYRFQEANGLYATGNWDNDTINYLKSALWSGDNY